MKAEWGHEGRIQLPGRGYVWRAMWYLDGMGLLSSHFLFFLHPFCSLRLSRWWRRRACALETSRLLAHSMEHNVSVGRPDLRLYGHVFSSFPRCWLRVSGEKERIFSSVSNSSSFNTKLLNISRTVCAKITATMMNTLSGLEVYSHVPWPELTESTHSINVSAILSFMGNCLTEDLS